MDNQFAQNEEWSLLCNSLAAKLLAAGNTLAATLCFICAGNIDKTVEIWSRNLITEREGKSYVELLQVSLQQLDDCLLQVVFVFSFEACKYSAVVGFDGEDYCPCAGKWSEAI